MSHKASSSFWEAYDDLPPNIQRVADEKYAMLKADLTHPSLQFKKVGKLWSARVSQDYRALAYFVGQDYIWIWIGSHRDYDKRI